MADFARGDRGLTGYVPKKLTTFSLPAIPSYDESDNFDIAINEADSLIRDLHNRISKLNDRKKILMYAKEDAVYGTPSSFDEQQYLLGVLNKLPYYERCISYLKSKNNYVPEECTIYPSGSIYNMDSQQLTDVLNNINRVIKKAQVLHSTLLGIKQSNIKCPCCDLLDCTIGPGGACPARKYTFATNRCKVCFAFISDENGSHLDSEEPNGSWKRSH
jgi:hypothetical protein